MEIIIQFQVIIITSLLFLSTTLSFNNNKYISNLHSTSLFTNRKHKFLLSPLLLSTNSNSISNTTSNILESSYIEKATLYDQNDIFIYKRPRYSSYTIIDVDEDILMEEDINDEETKFFRSRSKKRKEMIHQTSLDVGWKPFAGIIADIKRRWSKESYISDWKDGVIKGNKKKTLSAILFLYFACLAPTVAFGGLTNLITDGKMGVLEFIISCGSSGIIYSLFSGQPMTFLGPTGLTLAFIAALYRFTAVLNIPFFCMYAWTGLWTSLFIALSAIFNLSNLLKLCTRFTDDCFNALLSLNFLYEASLSVVRNFYKPEADLVAAFAATNIALGTWQSTNAVVKLRNSKLFNANIRKYISNFGPTIVILAISIFTSRLTGINIEKLSVPKVFGLAEGRSWFVDLFVVPMWLRIAAAGPAILLTMLFYLDQNISVRAVNSCEVKKGDAYHLDLLVLSGIVGVLSILGLPWTCAATVQSMNHVNAMSDFEKDEEGLERRKNIVETRVTGLAIHSCILGSLFLLPILAQIPLPVVSGIFFYFGNKLTQGNLLLTRLAHIFTEKKLLRKENIYNNLPHSTVYKFIAIQTLMLGLVWTLKQSKKFALFFPSCIALLMVTRSFLLPKLFKDSELQQLDPLM